MTNIKEEFAYFKHMFELDYDEKPTAFEAFKAAHEAQQAKIDKLEDAVAWEQARADANHELHEEAEAKLAEVSKKLDYALDTEIRLLIRSIDIDKDNREEFECKEKLAIAIEALEFFATCEFLKAKEALTKIRSE